MNHITPARVKKWLESNRKAGRQPASLYEVARFYGCSRSFLTAWMRGDKPSRPLEGWFARKMRRAA